MRILLLVCAVLLAPSTWADHCTTYSSSAPEAEAAGFYVESDMCQPGCLNFHGVYQETNGLEGLQRLDEVVDDTCGGVIQADTIVFGVYTG